MFGEDDSGPHSDKITQGRIIGLKSKKLFRRSYDERYNKDTDESFIY